MAELALAAEPPENVPPLQGPLYFIVDNVRCAACMATVERTVAALPGVDNARLHFGTRRLSVRPGGSHTIDAETVITALAGAGYPANRFNAELLGVETVGDSRSLIKPMAVAGFAATNVMMLSVAVWAGLVSDMDPTTRSLMHWISAIIALPAIAYAGQPFFRSAWTAVRQVRMNMDVPISLAVVLAAGLSLVQTIAGGEYVYFDASVMLLFFLLVGRSLDHSMRARARAVAHNLLGLQEREAMLKSRDGTLRAVPAHELQVGDRVMVARGAKVPADGLLEAPAASLDVSFLTGESAPAMIEAGAEVFAGAVNLDQEFEFRVTASGEKTILAEIVRLTEAAENSKGVATRWADRAARIYAPAVHLAGLATFLGWWLIGGLSASSALIIAISVLIITCPCALGLAVPAVQAVASGRLLGVGVLLKDGVALEQLATVDTILFDKTGTLTNSQFSLIADRAWGPDDLERAALLARTSRHPLSLALARAAGPGPAATDVTEQAGAGLSATIAGESVRLGNAAWCDVDTEQLPNRWTGMVAWFRDGDKDPVRFRFETALRSDAPATIKTLRNHGYAVEILSGDAPGPVSAAAQAVGDLTWQASQTPQQKIAYLQGLKDRGRRVLMVGDGLNDAPALAAATVSMSPSSAADIAQTAASLLFQGEHLSPVAEALKTAKKARRLVMQNFALAAVYNFIAVPIAVAGLASPLVAAVAMSASSIVVTANALRLHGRRPWTS